MMMTNRQLNALMSLLLGWPINLLLIWLILFRSENLLRIWIRVLLQTTILDLFALLIPYFIQPVGFVVGDVKFYYLDGVFTQSSRPIAIGLFYGQFFFIDLAKYSLMVLFFYRWLVVCREIPPTYWQYISLLAIPTAMVIVNMSIVQWCFSQDGLGPMECPTCPANATIFYTMPKNSSLIGLINLESAILEGTTYVVVILTNLMIWFKTRTFNSFQPASVREVNRQMGFVMLAQATIPMVIFAFPTAIVLIFNTLGLVRPEWLSIAYTQNWVWVVYPLISILVIRKYRRALFSCKKPIIIAPSNSNSLNIVVKPAQ